MGFLALAGLVRAEPVLLENPEVLPLALEDSFSFKKAKTFLNEDLTELDSEYIEDSMITFQRKRRMFGALTRIEQKQRYGQYFTFFWHSDNPADVTVRLEYRQEKLGSYVQAQEVSYEGVSGTNQTDFNITGDAFENDGPVTSWRALLIEDGRIVALHSSFLWN